MTRRSPNAGLERLVDAMLASVAPITQILEHMARSPTSPSPEAAVGTLRQLVVEARAPRGGDIPRRALHPAATVEAATEALLAEILLVPHTAYAPCEGRRH
jgi:hypothetical protein